jgi:hypothetical protein
MLWVTNSSNTPLVLCVEPWANEILTEPGKAYLAVFDGPEGKFPNVEWRKDSITRTDGQVQWRRCSLTVAMQKCHWSL